MFQAVKKYVENSHNPLFAELKQIIKSEAFERALNDIGLKFGHFIVISSFAMAGEGSPEEMIRVQSWASLLAHVLE